MAILIVRIWMNWTVILFAANHARSASLFMSFPMSWLFACNHKIQILVYAIKLAYRDLFHHLSNKLTIFTYHIRMFSLQNIGSVYIPLYSRFAFCGKVDWKFFFGCVCPIMAKLFEQFNSICQSVTWNFQPSNELILTTASGFLNITQ